MHIGHISLLVADYDEAIDFYTQKLRFVLLEDTPISPQKRWVLVSPSPTSECSLLLAKAANEDQQMQIGRQSGGRVFLFLYTDTFWETYEHLKAQGVIFLESPRQESYGCVVVFQDLYGNKWDLLENKKPKS